MKKTGRKYPEYFTNCIRDLISYLKSEDLCVEIYKTHYSYLKTQIEFDQLLEPLGYSLFIEIQFWI